MLYVRIAGLIVLMLVVCHGANKQDPTFTITRFEVEGNKWVSDALIVAESRLQVNRDYSEKDLIMSLRRITQLPFILRADLFLKKGDTYGTYVLVFQVSETRPVFYHLEKTWIESSDYVSIPMSDIPTSDNLLIPNETIAGGGRWFLGAYGMTYCLVGLEKKDYEWDDHRYTFVDVGFSHYCLFNRHIFLNFDLKFTRKTETNLWEFDTLYEVKRPISPSGTLAVPVKKNHWLSFHFNYFREDREYSYRDFDGNWIKDFMQSDKLLQVDMSWYYDTTNDPVIPDRGLVVKSGVSFIRLKYEDGYYGIPETNQSVSSVAQVFGNARRYWPLSNELSFSLEGEGVYRLHEKGDSILEPEYWTARMNAGVYWDLRRYDITERLGDLRLEAIMRLQKESFGGFGYHAGSIEAGVAFRNSWGLVRLSYRYARQSKFEDPIFMWNKIIR